MTDAEIVTYIRVQANKILDIVNRADEVGGAAMAMTVLQFAVEHKGAQTRENYRG